MNIEPLLNVIKNHELVILEPNQVRQLLGIKRLDNDTINELSEELGLLGFVLIPIRYNSSSNGLTNIRKAVIIKKDTYMKIVKHKDRNAIARAVIDYVFSNKQLFEVNVKNHNGVLKIQTSLIRKLLRYIGLDNHYIDTRMGSIVLTIRTLLEVSGFTTEFKRAMGRMNSIIYAYEDGGDEGPRVTEAGERLKNPPAKPEAGGKHDGNKSNPGPGKVHTGEKEGANHEELEAAGAGPNGAVGTTAGVRGSVGREGGRHSNAEVQNSEGGREGTTATQGGGD